MANRRNQSLLDNVRGTLGQFTGNRGRTSRGRGGLASQASGFIGGLLSGGDDKSTRGRGRSRSRSGGRRRR
jgi:hypothetical protein